MKLKYVFPMLAAMFAGLYFISAEAFMRYFGDSPLVMAIIINLAGGIFLLSFAKDRKKTLQKMPKKDILKLFIGSVLAFGVAYLLFYKAISLIGSSKVSFMTQSEPIFVFVLATIILGERFKIKELVGLIMILFGVMFLNLDISLISLSLGMGELYALGAALMFALCIIIVSKLINKYKNTLLLTGLEMIFGGLSLCVFLFIHPVEFKIVWILPLLIFGLFFALSWLTYNLGIQKIGASKTAIMYSSKSVFTLSFSFLSVKFFPSLGLKIPLSLLSFLIGGSIIIVGVVLLKMFKSS
jgi:drug/metabolite transporter (DMT)-like permease